jgi:4-methyl-5(b-hydroxyethyl)-thiazole monophosphate biosynthesis
MKKTMLVVLAEGFEDIEAIAPIDVLTRAGCEVTVAGLVDGPVKAAYGTTILPQTTLEKVGDSLYDGIFFPGGRKNAQALAADKRAIQLARRHYEAGKLVSAICAAPSHVLGEAAGLLKGKRASGDPSFNDKLAASGAIVTDQMVTVDGNIITGVGPGAAMLFALEVTEYLCGREVVEGYAAKWGIVRQ